MNISSFKSFIILTKPAEHPRLLLIQPILAAVNELRTSEGMAVNLMQWIVADNRLQIQGLLS